MLYKLAVCRLKEAEDGFYGVRHRARELGTCASLLDLLVWTVSACEAQWREIMTQDFTHFVQLSYGRADPNPNLSSDRYPRSSLDCVARAGQVGYYYLSTYPITMNTFLIYIILYIHL